MWCRLCTRPLCEESFLLRYGPVDFHFCDEAHYKLWKQYRFHPKAYFILRSMPPERLALLPEGVLTEEFLKGLEE